jgi:hypothetical protein
VEIPFFHDNPDFPFPPIQMWGHRGGIGQLLPVSQRGRFATDIQFRTEIEVMTIRNNGKTMARKLRGLAIASTMVALIAGISSTARAQDEQSRISAPRIEGSWIFEVEAIDNSYHFTAVSSFTAGGVFLATGSGDRVIPVSPLYGSWKYRRANRFHATANFFGFDPSGKPIGMNHVVQAFELKNNNELHGFGEFWNCDVHGENCQRVPQLDFRVTAKRIIPEDLE